MLRNIFLILLACFAAPVAAAQELVPLPGQPDGVAWPTAGWETGAPASQSTQTRSRNWWTSPWSAGAGTSAAKRGPW